jgi:hypothetical protein
MPWYSSISGQFRHSGKYRGFVSDRRFDFDVL